MRILLPFVASFALAGQVRAAALRSTPLVALDGLPLCQNEGTIVSSCTGLESRPNGGVAGSATASAAFGTLGVFAQFTHTALESTVVREIGVAQAVASFEDRLCIASGPTTLMAFNFELEGQAIGPELKFRRLSSNCGRANRWTCCLNSCGLRQNLAHDRHRGDRSGRKPDQSGVRHSVRCGLPTAGSGE